MFTGIVTDIGEVLELEQRGDLRARIATGYDVAGIDIGASIACDGVCLTVVGLGPSPQDWFDVRDLGRDRVARPILRRLGVGQAAQPGTRAEGRG